MAVTTHGLKMGRERLSELSPAGDPVVLASALARADRALHDDRGIWKDVGLFELVEYAVDHGVALGRVNGAIGLITILRREPRASDGEEGCADNRETHG